MKFSIITATYNSAHGIADCLASIEKQMYPSIERVVVDGLSTDNTLALIAASATPVDQLVSQKDSGIYDALNKGLRLATGDILGFLHSDDLLAGNNVIAEIARVFEEYEVDGVYGDLVYIARDNPAQVVRYWRSRPFSPALLPWGWMPPHPTLYLRRSVYEKHGLYDKTLSIAADYDFILRIMSDPDLRFAYLPQVIVNMRLGGVSNRSLTNILQKSREDLLALRRNKVGGVGSLLWKNLSKLPQFFS